MNHRCPSWNDQNWGGTVDLVSPIVNFLFFRCTHMSSKSSFVLQLNYRIVIWPGIVWCPNFRSGLPRVGLVAEGNGQQMVDLHVKQTCLCHTMQIYCRLYHGSLNVPIEHHPTIRYMVYNGYYKVMSNIPKMGQLPTPVYSVEIHCVNVLEIVLGRYTLTKRASQLKRVNLNGTNIYTNIERDAACFMLFMLFLAA